MVAVVGQEEREKGTGEMMEPVISWPQYSHEHTHHISLNYVSPPGVAHFLFTHIFYNCDFDFSSVPQSSSSWCPITSSRMPLGSDEVHSVKFFYISPLIAFQMTSNARHLHFFYILLNLSLSNV